MNVHPHRSSAQYLIRCLLSSPLVAPNLLSHMAEATGEIISDVIHHLVAIPFDRQLRQKALSGADEESLES
jgi:hypothetical protein